MKKHHINFFLIGLFFLVFTVFAACAGKDDKEKPEGNAVSIIYNANGGTGTMPPQSVNENTTASLKSNTFTRTGYTFTGWSADEAGTVTYQDGESVTVGKTNLNLFAVWKANAYTIIFNANGGSGGQTADVKAVFDSPMPALSATAPVHAAFDFNGYFDAQTNGARYYNADLSSARNWDKTANTTLFAQYSEKPSVTQDNSSIVSLVQSMTVSDPAQFTYASIKALVDEAIALAGGLEGIVKFGDTVVLKPNIITTYYSWAWPNGTVIPSGAENAAAAAAPNGIVTDWRVVQAVAENVRTIIGEKGVQGSGKIFVMEGSGKGNETEGTMKQFANVNYTLQNLTAVDEIIGIDLIGGTGADGKTYWTSVPFEIPDGILKVQLENPVFTSPWPPMYNGDGVYYVVEQMYKADALICIPVLKNHWSAAATGAIKNISIGATPPRVYGNNAGDIGRNNRIPHTDSNGLQKWIADYYAVMPADFVVMDALQGCDNGPLPGSAVINSAQKKMRSILASRDGLALDTVEANIIHVDYTKIGHLSYLTQRGEVGTKQGKRLKVQGNPKDITVVGNKKAGDLRSGVSFAGNLDTGGIGSTRLTAEQLAKPDIVITSAQFEGQNLNINLNISSNAVKVDIYIDNKYIRSVNSGLNKIAIDASTITGDAGSSHNITVYAYTEYMAYGQASITAIK